MNTQSHQRRCFIPGFLQMGQDDYIAEMKNNYIL